MKMHNTLKHFLMLLVLHFCNGYRVVDVRGVQTVLAVDKEEVVMKCEDNVPMSYCGFTHPNGTKLPYTGPGLDIGHCSVILNIATTDTGVWSCHMGHRDSAGKETSNTINVRVVDRLAAVETNVTVRQERDVTLRCTTSQHMMPLSYCRFVPPQGKPFGIDARITQNQAIRGKYFFPEDLSLDRGDCAVSILGATLEDAGAWLCEAWLEDDVREFSDTIQLHVQDYPVISPATTAVVSFSSTLLLAAAVLVSVVLWKRRSSRFRCTHVKDKQKLTESQMLAHEYTDIPQITVQVVRSNSSGYLEDIYIK